MSLTDIISDSFVISLEASDSTRRAWTFHYVISQQYINYNKRYFHLETQPQDYTLSGHVLFFNCIPKPLRKSYIDTKATNLIQNGSQLRVSQAFDLVVV